MTGSDCAPRHWHSGAFIASELSLYNNNNNNNNNNFWWSLISTRRAVHEFAVIVMPAIYIELASHDRRMDYTETCTPLGSPAGLVGAQMGVKTPLAHYGGA